MPTTSPLAYLREFLQRPAQVASIVPSSRFLESRIVRLGELAEESVVVELGPGSGGTTTAILNELPPTAKLIAIELNEEFIPRLNEIDDQRLVVHQGDASELPEILGRHGVDRADVIYSGIPFSSIPQSLGRSIVEAVWSSLTPGGRFVAYQLRSRVRELAADLMGTPEVEFELFNVPPLWVYRWLKQPEFSSVAVGEAEGSMLAPA